MATNIIGRDPEISILQQLLDSHRPEFLAIYGRRRVGKTFLIRNFFTACNDDVLFFNVTGVKDGNLKSQIRHFTSEISRVFYNNAPLAQAKNWDLTFEQLTKAINTLPKNKKIILFLDEFPWMASKRSNLLQNLDHYWNQHWSHNSKIKLIICGSSASWIINKILNNKGGLHNRVTKTIQLTTFNLKDTASFLAHMGINFDTQHILQLYMVTGGVPFYLTQLGTGKSATQLIEKLAFSRKSFLLMEFENLFAALFNNSDIYVTIIRIIAKCRYGIGQEELLKKLGQSLSGRGGLSKLKELEDAGFIISFKPYLHKKRGLYYRVIDEYTLFYLTWIEPIKDILPNEGMRQGYWENIALTSTYTTWAGYAFEAICYKHLHQISDGLQLNPTAIPGVWRHAPKRTDAISGAQIDLLFNRLDNAITICEIKYTNKPFVITKQYAENLLNKQDVFKKVTKTTKTIFIAMISANGIKQNTYATKLLTDVLTAQQLFL